MQRNDIPADPSTKVIEELALVEHLKNPKRSLDVLIKKLNNDSQVIIDKMVADMSNLNILKMFAVTVKTILTRLYHRGVHVKEHEVEQLRQVALKAAATKTSIIFMPSHKSHIDYLVVSYVLYRMGIALPHIAAGDNLDMPFVGYVLRHNGAFFIRREWGGDRLYITIMKDYIGYLMDNGYNVEAFIEGTRSRTGKLLQPKFGFIKLILENLLINKTQDAIVIPVNIGYDKVIETPSYINELLGTPKEKESIFQMLSSLNLFQLKWGRVDVRFGEPLSLREYIDKNLKSNSADSISEKVNSLLQRLGYKILAEVNKMSVIMPTALIGTVLLTLRGRGVGRSELIRRVTWLKKEITERGGQVAEGRVSTAVVVDRAVRVLDGLIGKRYDILENVYYPMRRFELSYYRNQVIHLFVPEAILSIAMYATIKIGGPIEAQRILVRTRLHEDCTFVSKLLKYEFVYGPGGMDENLENTLEKMLDANVIEVGRNTNGDEWMTLSSEERRTGREIFDFYCFLMWPFIESYWVAAVSIYTILPNRSVTEGLHWIDKRMFSSRAQILAKTLYYEGDISYFESINKETIGNAIVRFRDSGVIRTFKGVAPPPPGSFVPSIYKTTTTTEVPADSLPEALLPAKTIIPHKLEWSGPIMIDTRANKHEQELEINDIQDPKSYHIEPAQEKTRDIENLHQSYLFAPPSAHITHEEIDAGFDSWSQIRPSGRLWDLCEEIGRFRREGKNRRDNSTVAIRVLRLARFASSWDDGRKGASKAPQQAKL